MALSSAGQHEAATGAWRYIVILATLALLPRFVLWYWYWIHPEIGLYHDETDYDQLARNLVEEGVYGYEQPGGAVTPASLRPPLYPAFLAAIYRLFPSDRFMALSVARLLQGLLSLATAGIVFSLARRLFDDSAARVGAAIVCFYPSLLFYNQFVLTEVLFTLLLCSFVWATVIALQERSLVWLATGAFFLGLAALTRSVVYLFPLLLAPFIAAAWTGPIRERLLAGALALAVSIAPMVPWSIRNTQLHGTFLVVDCMGGRNFMMGNYEYTPLYRAWDAISLTGEQAWYHVLRQKYPEMRGLTQGQLDKLALREGIRFVFDHPDLTVERDIIKLIQFWGLEREVVEGARRGQLGPLPHWLILLLAGLVPGSYALVAVAAIWGAWLAPKKAVACHVLVLLVVGTVCGLHTLSFGHSRYHVPLMPLLAGYAGAAYACWRAGTWLRTPIRLTGATLTTLALVGAWVFEVVFVEWDKIVRLLG
ncbi:MAG: hypothetical protein C4297_01150 [Gemmataceae bacterium]